MKIIDTVVYGLTWLTDRQQEETLAWLCPKIPATLKHVLYLLDLHTRCKNDLWFD